MKQLKVGNLMTVTVGAKDPENPNLGYDYGGCSIESDLEREVCKHCGASDCCYSCDLSLIDLQQGKSERRDDRDDVEGRIRYNGCLDGIEALVLALASAGVDVTTPQFLEAVETAIDAAANNT